MQYLTSIGVFAVFFDWFTQDPAINATQQRPS